MTQTATNKKIVCATRGGKASLILQSKTIQLAREENANLVFVYVVTTESLGEMSEKMTQAAREELTWFGQALLQVAQLRAERVGIHAETLVREGSIREEIIQVMKETKADLLVLGKSRTQNPIPAFKEVSLNDFARQVEANTGAKVQIISLDNH